MVGLWCGIEGCGRLCGHMVTGGFGCGFFVLGEQGNLGRGCAIGVGVSSCVRGLFL